MKDGKTTQAEVERALRNLFRLRIRLGMLDPPASVPYYNVRYNDTELQFNQEHVAVAKKVRIGCFSVLRTILRSAFADFRRNHHDRHRQRSRR